MNKPTFEVGDLVRNSQVHLLDDECMFTGTVIGFGMKGDLPVVLVNIGYTNGGYINNENTYCYVSTLVVCPEYLEKIETFDEW